LTVDSTRSFSASAWSAARKSAPADIWLRTWSLVSPSNTTTSSTFSFTSWLSSTASRSGSVCPCGEGDEGCPSSRFAGVKSTLLVTKLLFLALDGWRGQRYLQQHALHDRRCQTTWPSDAEHRDRGWSARTDDWSAHATWRRRHRPGHCSGTVTPARCVSGLELVPARPWSGRLGPPAPTASSW
jgi:hypothetical protein